MLFCYRTQSLRVPVWVPTSTVPRPRGGGWCSFGPELCQTVQDCMAQGPVYPAKVCPSVSTPCRPVPQTCPHSTSGTERLSINTRPSSAGGVPQARSTVCGALQGREEGQSGSLLPPTPPIHADQPHLPCLPATPSCHEPTGPSSYDPSYHQDHRRRSSLYGPTSNGLSPGGEGPAISGGLEGLWSRRTVLGPFPACSRSNPHQDLSPRASRSPSRERQETFVRRGVLSGFLD